ncbi:hypothetical protein OK016_01155 [Vibrio chagasii]|nr:hypothetical protein [Vibrio chagasii]
MRNHRSKIIFINHKCTLVTVVSVMTGTSSVIVTVKGFITRIGIVFVDDNWQGENLIRYYPELADDLALPTR